MQNRAINTEKSPVAKAAKKLQVLTDPQAETLYANALKARFNKDDNTCRLRNDEE